MWTLWLPLPCISVVDFSEAASARRFSPISSCNCIACAFLPVTTHPPGRLYYQFILEFCRSASFHSLPTSLPLLLIFALSYFPGQALHDVLLHNVMDGVDISSNSESGDDNTHVTNSDPIGRELWSSGSNLAMESDVDAELDYDEENADNEEMEQIKEQSKVTVTRNGIAENSDRNECDGDSIKQSALNVGVDHNETEIDRGKEDVKDDLSEEGEIDDLEEGELKSDEDSVTGSIRSNENSVRRSVGRNRGKVLEDSPHRSWRYDPASVGICKFYLRGTCTWGPDCKYLHMKELRLGDSIPVQSSSNESIHSQRPNATKERRSRSREFTKPCISGLTVYPSSSTSNENEGSHGDETAWEKGLRQARELMIRASKKREEEPDFDRKRLILAPSGDTDRPRTTDEESDDSRGHHKIRHRTSRSPLSRGIVRGLNGFMVRTRVDIPCPRLRKYDNQIESNDITGDRNFELERHGIYERNQLAKPRKIPSLIDTMLEGKRLEFSRRYDYGRDEFSRVPPKDLGPQVLYPNGRPAARRHGTFPRREVSPNDHYRISRCDSTPRSPHSPLSRTSRDSQSPNLQRSLSSSGKRRGSPLIIDRREASRKRNDIVAVGGLLSAGNQIHDPWERSHKKRRSKERELISLTLGAELQKTRRTNDNKKQICRQDTASSTSSASRRSASVASSVTSRSRSHSRASSGSRHQSTFRLSLVSAVASRNLIDDDGSLRATDLSSFRIPKKKRSSPALTLHRSSTVAVHGSLHTFERSNNQNKRYTSTISLKRPSSPSLRSGIAQCGTKKVKDVIGRTDKAHKRNVLHAGKDDMLSDESSSSTSRSSSSSSDDAEPAAYRLKKKVDDGLPTEGIPLSPEAAAEDVSSDEDENASDTSIHEPIAQHSKKIPLIGNSRPASRKAIAECHESRIDDNDYVDNEAEKEERRAELLRQLKCVEEAIARKRSRPVI
ncbi:Zinc finger CCCH domain-containing protein [Dirofilaria immitis]